jgi:hypothetical protein
MLHLLAVWIPGVWKHVIYRRTELREVQATGVLIVNRDEFMDVHMLVKSLQDKIFPRINTDRNHIQSKWTCAEALAEKVSTLMQLNWNGIKEPPRNYPTY